MDLVVFECDQAYVLECFRRGEIGFVDLNQKLAAWENFCNFSRPHGAHGSRVPYEALKSMLGLWQICLTRSGILHS